MDAMKSISAFTNDNTYSSPGRKISWIAKCFPTQYVYARLFNVIISAARKGKRGVYYDTDYLNDSIRIVRIMEKAGVRFYFENLHVMKNINSPCVIIANHMSMLETFILNIMILPWQKMTFVIKEDLLHYPVFKYVLLDRNPIAVTRKNPRKDLMTVLEEGVRRLKEGTSVAVFPQTTRSLNIDLSSFNSIGIKLALKANVPIVPLALKTDVWGNGKWIKDLGKIDPAKDVHFYFGEPVTPGGNKKVIHEQIVSLIHSKLIQWKNTEVRKES